MAEGETAGNLGVRSFSGRTHSTRKEKTPVLSLTAGDRICMDERDAADSSFCGCQTAGFGEKPATRRQVPSAGRESCFLASALEISAEKRGETGIVALHVCEGLCRIQMRHYDCIRRVL